MKEMMRRIWSKKTKSEFSHRSMAASVNGRCLCYSENNILHGLDFSGKQLFILELPGTIVNMQYTFNNEIAVVASTDEFHQIFFLNQNGNIDWQSQKINGPEKLGRNRNETEISCSDNEAILTSIDNDVVFMSKTGSIETIFNNQISIERTIQIYEAIFFLCAEKGFYKLIKTKGNELQWEFRINKKSCGPYFDNGISFGRDRIIIGLYGMGFVIINDDGKELIRSHEKMEISHGENTHGIECSKIFSVGYSPDGKLALVGIHDTVYGFNENGQVPMGKKHVIYHTNNPRTIFFIDSSHVLIDNILYDTSSGASVELFEHQNIKIISSDDRNVFLIDHGNEISCYSITGSYELI